MPGVKKVLVVGGGMIVHDQVLPSLLHLQRVGRVGEIDVCSLRESTFERLRQAFPGGGFQCVRGYQNCLRTDARVIWSNGACLNVQNALGFPDAAPGTNTQGLTMYCSGGDAGALISHSVQFRGLKYSFADGAYSEPSPDYFQFVEWAGEGLRPVGYGYDSIAALVAACHGYAGDLVATPANSSYNEASIEAGRASLLSGGELVKVQD